MRHSPRWEYYKIVTTLAKSSEVLGALGQEGWEAYASYPHPVQPNKFYSDFHIKIVVMLKRKIL